MGNMVGLNPFEINDLVPRMATGTVIEHKVSADLGPGRFKYVRFLDAVTYARGHVCTWAAPATGIPARVTNDISGGSSLGTRTAGIACAVMTQNYYGFVQISGIALILGGGSVAAGNYTVPNGDGSSVAFTDPGNEEAIFAFALTADATTEDPLATLTLYKGALVGGL